MTDQIENRSRNKSNKKQNIDVFAGRSNKVIPSLVSNDAKQSIEFYKNVFDAKVMYVLEYSGKIVHAEIQINGTTLMLSDEMYGDKIKSAKTIGDTPISLYVYVDDVDSTVDRAIKSGAKIMYPVQDEFWGDRAGTIIDPFGFKWNIATHVRDVTMEEIIKKTPEMMKQMKNQTLNTDKNSSVKQNTNILTGGSRDFYKKYMKYKKKYQDMKYNISLII